MVRRICFVLFAGMAITACDTELRLMAKVNEALAAQKSCYQLRVQQFVDSCDDVDKAVLTAKNRLDFYRVERARKQP